MKKFLLEHIKCNGVVEKEEWTREYIQPIQDFVDEYKDDLNTSINDVGLDESNTLIFVVHFFGKTKKECDAWSTLFQSRLFDLLKPYGLKRCQSTLKAYGDKI